MIPSHVEVTVAPLAALPTNIYYAHPLRHYGTPRAEAARQRIRQLFPGCTLHCPETMQARYDEAARTSKPLTTLYREIVTECVGRDGGIVLTKYTDLIGRGVYEEVAIALGELHIPVWVLLDGALHRVAGARIVNPNNYLCYAEIQVHKAP